MSKWRWKGKVRKRLMSVMMALAIVGGVAAITVVSAIPASAGVAGNDYPWSGAVDCSATYGEYSWCESGNDISPLGFGYRNCTDYVAYELNEQMGGTVSSPDFSYSAFGFNSSDGNAEGWETAITNHLGASAANNTPAVGSVAWYNRSWGGGFGHVAIVASVLYNSDGSANSITVDDYNYLGTGNYDTYTIDSGASNWPDGFLHVADLSAGSEPPSSSTLWGINTSGQAIRYAGSGSWTFEGGPTFQSIASDSGGSTVVGLSTAGLPYTYSGGGAWHMVSGQTLISTADPGTLWGINTSGQAIRYAGSGSWTFEGGPTFQSIASDGTSVVGLSTAGLPYTYSGDGAWHMVSGATLISVGTSS